MKKLAACEAMILRYGADILESSNMQMEKMFMQHGDVSVFEHSVFVACVCLLIAGYLHIRVNHRALCCTIISCTTGMYRMRATGSMGFITRGRPARTRPGILTWERSRRTRSENICFR